MNDDAFEDKLRALACALHRDDPTPEWKAEILDRARREAVIRTPRWLLAGLGMAWVCIAILRITTPDTDRITHGLVVADARVEAVHGITDTPFRALIALQSNPEFPDRP